MNPILRFLRRHDQLVLDFKKMNNSEPQKRMTEAESTGVAWLLILAALVVWVGAILTAAGWWGLKGAGLAIIAGPLAVVALTVRHYKAKYPKGKK